MPGKNIEKIYVPDNFYHVYNRGLGKMDIFADDEDYRVFLNLLKRSFGQKIDRHPKKGYTYPNYHGDLKLLSYCLMPNHFHLLIKTQSKPKKLPEMMKSVLTAYVMYFNRKYSRQGPLFGTRYRAVRVIYDEQLWHISRYIHLNPIDLGVDYARYEYSSIDNYINGKKCDWLQPEELLEMFKAEKQDYHSFLSEYEEKRAELVDLKRELF